MTGPNSDPHDAENPARDDDFAAEHSRPTYSDEPSTERHDESVPTGRGGDGGMDLGKRRRRRRRRAR